MRGLSRLSPGTFAGCEPMAMMRVAEGHLLGAAVEHRDIEASSGSMSVAAPRRYLILRAFASCPVPLVSCLTTLSLKRAQLVDVDLRRRRRSTPHADGVRGFVEHLGDVQQRLRRDAAAVDADAARVRLAVDERDLQPAVGGVEGGRVAAGTGADDDESVTIDMSGGRSRRVRDPTSAA